MNWRSLTLAQLIPGRRLRRAALVLLMAALFVSAVPAITQADTAPAPPRRPAYALSDSLIAYWKLEEASGTRYDELNGCGGSGCDLTDNNTVTQNTGIIGNAGEFTMANNEYLSHDDNADLSTGNIDFTVVLWVYLKSKPQTLMRFVNKNSGTNNQREFSVMYHNVTDLFVLQVSSDGTVTNTIDDTVLGHPSLSTWYFVTIWHDAVSDTINIQTNNGNVNSQSYSNGVFDSSSPWILGGQTAADVYYLDGRLDSVGFWKRVLTSTERGYLYNSGAGCDYPFTACEPTPTPTVTLTPTLTPTVTDTPTVTLTPTLTPTITDTPTVTPTITDTPTLTPTITDTPTLTPTITDTPTVTPTITDTPTVTHTPTPTFTPTPTDTPGPYAYDIDSTLSSGNRLLILRRFTFGEIALGVLVLAIVLGGIGKFIYDNTRQI